MSKYRAFISYSHKDVKSVVKLVEILENNGILPLWDKNLSFGSRFPEAIKDFIASSHVFIPLITESSNQRGWVHQEIGYAMALNVPVLPIVMGTLPEAMLHELHAITWEKDEDDDLANKLSEETFKFLVEDSHIHSPLYEVAETSEDRTMMMVDYARKVYKLGCSGRVRQIGALSSFHIPDEPVYHEKWVKRHSNLDKCQLNMDFRNSKLLEERKILEKHALKSGCRLIINPSLDFKGDEARSIRIQELLDFLKSMDDDKVEVVFNEEMMGRNLTILGDWFLAESVSGSLGGYKQTVFTRHAPTVNRKKDAFDHEFDSLMKDQNQDGKSSREYAIERLNDILDGKK
jgi:hypothetical protein